MQPSDFKRFNAVMNGIAELHQRELSQFLMDAYWLALRDWTLQDFESAAVHLMETLKWMPKPSDFANLRTAGQLTAGEAWEFVLSGAPLEPGSRLARAAAIVGGQAAIRHANVEHALPHIQRRFMESYEELVDVDVVREALPQIARPDYRVALSRPEPLANIASRLVPPKDVSKVAVLPAPTEPKTPAIVVSAREKILKLVRVQPGMSDDDIAKISGESIELVREVRAAASTEVAA